MGTVFLASSPETPSPRVQRTPRIQSYQVTGEDDSHWRLYGPQVTFEAQANGWLEFLINDNAVEKHAGEFRVTIDITRTDRQ